MSMKDWAEREVAAACKRENPNWDGKSFEYGCGCYQSALKAFKSLCDDGHSGYSFSVTKSILEKLLNNIPLSPITEDDFDDEYPIVTKNGTQSYQCSRRSSLFKDIDKDGNVTYHDNDRIIIYDILLTDCGFYSCISRIIDEMFPISMPYSPKPNEFYTIYVRTFKTDNCKDDFDTREIIFIITPDGKRIDIHKYWGEKDGGEWRELSKEEYEDALSRRADKIEDIIGQHILFQFIDNHSLSEEENNERRRKWYSLPDDVQDKFINEIQKYCTGYNDDDYCLKYANFATFGKVAALEERFDDDNLNAIQDVLKSLDEALKSVE